MKHLESKNQENQPSSGIDAVQNATSSKALLVLMLALAAVTGCSRAEGPEAPASLELADEDVDRQLGCLRERFFEIVEDTWFSNKWVKDNCGDMDLSDLEDVYDVVEERKALLREHGLPGNLVEWWKEDFAKEGNMSTRIMLKPSDLSRKEKMKIKKPVYSSHRNK